MTPSWLFNLILPLIILLIYSFLLRTFSLLSFNEQFWVYRDNEIHLMSTQIERISRLLGTKRSKSYEDRYQ